MSRPAWRRGLTPRAAHAGRAGRSGRRRRTPRRRRRARSGRRRSRRRSSSACRVALEDLPGLVLDVGLEPHQLDRLAGAKAAAPLDRLLAPDPDQQRRVGLGEDVVRGEERRAGLDQAPPAPPAPARARPRIRCAARRRRWCRRRPTSWAVEVAVQRADARPLATRRATPRRGSGAAGRRRDRRARAALGVDQLAHHRGDAARPCPPAAGASGTGPRRDIAGFDASCWNTA